MAFKILSLVIASLLALAGPVAAQELDLTKPETYDNIMQLAKQPLDTAKSECEADQQE